jgi:TolB protein
MKKFLKVFILCLLLQTLAAQSFASVAFAIKNEEIPKTKILFIGFDQTDPYLRSGAFEIMERVRINLKTTDLFEVLKQSTTAQNTVGTSAAAQHHEKQLIAVNDVSAETIPDFAKYSASGIGAIIIAQFNRDIEGNMEIRLRAWDVLDQRQLFGKFYTASKDNYRKVAAAISNEIFKSITSEASGHFTSQILYVSEGGTPQHRIKRINIIDFDGENHRVLTDGKELVLTPIFSKKRDEVFYVRYFQGRPQIFSLNTKTLRSQKLGGFRITTIAPSIHPKNENLVLLSAIEDGNSDIYEMNIAENSAKKLTKNPGIDTTPSYSPDGNFIAFSSDRASGQQIYVMSVDGYSLKRLSTGSGTYSKPIWSPDGKMIAFTKIQGGQFYIGLMASDGTSEKILSSGYLVEGAKWSPNGRYLIFSKKKGAYGKDSVPRLWIVDIVTGFEFELPTPQGEGATDPDWS